MIRAERRLLYHLAIAIAVKLAVLVGLWWMFVHDARVHVDPERAASHIGAKAPPQGVSP